MLTSLDCVIFESVTVINLNSRTENNLILCPLICLG